MDAFLLACSPPQTVARNHLNEKQTQHKARSADLKIALSALFALSVVCVAAAGARAAARVDDWNATQIAIHLNDEATISARRTGLDEKENGWTWRGEIEETGEPAILMWWKDGRFGGSFAYRGDLYTLKSVTNAGNVDAHTVGNLQEIPTQHAAMHPQFHLESSASFEARRSQSGGTVLPEQEATAYGRLTTQQHPPPISLAERRAMAAKNITIDVMILYTSRVRSKYLDVVTDVAAHSIKEANGSFVNSGIGNVKLRLVHTQEMDYDETGSEHFNHLYRMVDGVGAFANVRALRDEKRADVVVLVVDDASGCGLATRVSADAEEAFAVVHHACAALTYSVPHEIGHIIGAGHDAALNQEAPFSYGHGFVNGTKWRDIMSYKASCDGCPRLALWSNPTITIEGEPAGTAQADNARVILEQAERVSKFR